MVATEAAKARGKPIASWSAYDCLLQGRELANSYREPEAVSLLVRAVTISPQFALAHAWLAMALMLANLYSDDAGPLAEADVTSKRALELDPSDATSQWARAMVLVWRGDHELAGSYFKRAIGLNPADIQIKGDYAEWLRLSGFATEALATIDNAIALGPFVPDWFAIVRGHILFDLGRYAEAARALENLPRQLFHMCGERTWCSASNRQGARPATRPVAARRCACHPLRARPGTATLHGGFAQSGAVGNDFVRCGL